MGPRPLGLLSSRRTAGRLLQFAVVSVLRFGHVNLRQHTATAAAATASPLRKEAAASRLHSMTQAAAEPGDRYKTTAGEGG